MKAAVYYENGGPEVLRYEDVPDPVLDPGGVIIRVEAIPIEGGDTLNRQGGELVTVPHIVGAAPVNPLPLGLAPGRRGTYFVNHAHAPEIPACR